MDAAVVRDDKRRRVEVKFTPTFHKIRLQESAEMPPQQVRTTFFHAFLQSAIPE